MYMKNIEIKGKEDAIAGTFKPSQFEDVTERMVYVRAYLGAREKMGLLGKVGIGR
jgi:hypothetical protein